MGVIINKDIFEYFYFKVVDYSLNIDIKNVLLKYILKKGIIIHRISYLPQSVKIRLKTYTINPSSIVTEILDLNHEKACVK